MEFSEVIEASNRFLHLAEAASQDGILGWQISANESGEFSCVAFTGTEVNVTTEDFNWAFKTIAVFDEYRGHFLENLYEGNRKVYALTRNSDRTSMQSLSEELYGYYDEDLIDQPVYCFKELIEMLAEAGQEPCVLEIREAPVQEYSTALPGSGPQKPGLFRKLFRKNSAPETGAPDKAETSEEAQWLETLAIR